MTTTGESMIRGGTPTIFVSDMGRAIRFYTETLGLRLHYQAGEHFAMVDAGDGLMLGLHPPSPNAAAPGTVGSVEIGLTVTQPIADVVATLAGRGVAFADDGDGPVRDDGPVKLAFFTDPDGTKLYLCEST